MLKPTGSDETLIELLKVVIDQYISKGEPIGSKFLHGLEELTYAPSTLRKYLNMLEKTGFVYQPYNSSGRLPTVEGLSAYVDSLLRSYGQESLLDENFDVEYTRNSLRYVVESMGKVADGVVVGFLKNDEYYFLGINNLLKDTTRDDVATTKYIVDIIEHKQLITLLDQKLMKRSTVYYMFVEDGDTKVAVLYTRIHINDYEGIVAIVGSTRMQYKKNISLLHALGRHTL